MALKGIQWHSVALNGILRVSHIQWHSIIPGRLQSNLIGILGQHVGPCKANRQILMDIYMRQHLIVCWKLLTESIRSIHRACQSIQ